MKQWQQIFLGIIIGLMLAAVLLLITGRPKGRSLILSAAPIASNIMVHVDGEVVHPGVYSLPPSSRVIDAIEAAGGFAFGADTAAVNQASFLSDGTRIFIPKEGQTLVSTDPDDEAALLLSAEKIDINTATGDLLETLPDIGPKTAEQIILYRQENGNFVRIEDIMNVPGIGQATFDTIKDLIVVE